MTSQTPTVSWHRVQDSEDKHYEKADSKEHHQLHLNHSITGMLEIDITFSNSACEKSNAVKYNSELLSIFYALYSHFIPFQLKVC